MRAGANKQMNRDEETRPLCFFLCRSTAQSQLDPLAVSGLMVVKSLQDVSEGSGRGLLWLEMWARDPATARGPSDHGRRACSRSRLPTHPASVCVCVCVCVYQIVSTASRQLGTSPARPHKCARESGAARSCD